MNKQLAIEKIVTRIIGYPDSETHMNADIWDWVSGVGMYGIAGAWRYTGNEAYLQYLKDWVARHWTEAEQLKTVNHTAPFLTILFLYEVTKGSKYLEACQRVADWLSMGATKTRDGGLEHTVIGTDRHEFPEQMWGDTLFMAIIFLAKMGRLTGDCRYVEAACKQLALHHRMLKDQNSGLFYHGWNCLTRNWMSGVLWARANAWITASTVEILAESPDEFEGREKIVASLNEQVAALEKVQRQNGMFGTILDSPDSYDETSATAGFAYGIKRGIANNIVAEQFAAIWEKAEQAVVARVNEAGEVTGVSGGTPVMPSKEAYNKIPRLPTLYGQGLTLLMLCQEPANLG